MVRQSSDIFGTLCMFVEQFSFSTGSLCPVESAAGVIASYCNVWCLFAVAVVFSQSRYCTEYI